jgi:hypothetical protein
LSEAAAQPVWIGPRPDNSRIFALMTVGVVGLIVPGLQPLLLGGLAEAGRVSATQLGAVATAEMLAMGLTAGLAGSVLRASGLKRIAIVALIALAAMDALTPLARGAMIILVRALAGVPSGVLVWITIAFIARTPTPERWAGAYVTAQTLAQFVMAAALTAFVVSRYGADGCFMSLAALCIITLCVALSLPSDLAPLPAAATAGLPDLRGWAALAASFLFLAASSGVWVYVEQLSHQARHGAGVAGQAVSVSLALQTAGGLAATVLAGRISWLWALVCCALADLGIFAGFATMPEPLPFIALTGALGFAWLFASPFLVPMTIEADPTRRAALLIGGAQLIGGSLGPLFASFCVTDADARGALAFAAACVTAGAAIVLGLHAARSR